MFFLKILVCLFFNIYHKYSIVLYVAIYVHGNFIASKFLSTSLICLALDVCYILISCCPLPNSIYSANCCMHLLKISLHLIFCYFIYYFRCYTLHEDFICNSLYIFDNFFYFIPGILFVVSGLNHTWVSLLCTN